jgi:uncharacterized lipoprotein YmbA
MNMRNLLLVALVMVQTACSLGAPSKPSNFYVLSPAPGTPVAGREAVNVPLSVAVGPVTLPDIFDRPQIVSSLPSLTAGAATSTRICCAY